MVGVLGVYGQHRLLMAATVGVALVGIVLWGTLIGSLLPLLLRRLGFDPGDVVRAVRRDARGRHGRLVNGRSVGSW